MIGTNLLPPSGAGFSDALMGPLHCLWMYLNTAYRMTIDYLREVPQITQEICLEPADLPHPSRLYLTFDKIEMTVF